MSRFGRPLKTTGTVYLRPNTKYLWARYRNREGRIIKESTQIKKKRNVFSGIVWTQGMRGDCQRSWPARVLPLTSGQTGSWSIVLSRRTARKKHIGRTSRY